MRQLSDPDASFLYLETDSAPMHIGGIYLFGGADQSTPLPFPSFVAYLRSRLHVVPLFRQKLKHVPFRLGRPYWVDDTRFNIERHLAYISLKGKGDMAELLRLASGILEEPLKRDRPLWHITFVDGMSAECETGSQGFALIVRLHHAAIDAFRGEDIMSKLLEYNPEPTHLPLPRPWQPRQAPSARRVALQVGGDLVRQPFQLASLAGSAVQATARGVLHRQLHRMPLPFALFRAPRSPFNRPITASRRLVHASFALDRLKTVKALLGDVTLNDVVLGLCAETLTRYLTAQGYRSRQSLVAMTPVSVRSQSLQHPTGNQMSAMLLKLATQEPDPAARIREIHWNATASAPYREAIAADRLSEVIPSTLLALSARLYSELQFAQRYQPVFNLSITNVPGPRVPLFLQGAPLLRQFNTAPLFDSMGLVIVAVSYQQTLTLNFTLCPDAVPDGDQLAVHAEAGLLAIEAAAERLGPAEDRAQPVQPGKQSGPAEEKPRYLEELFRKGLRRRRS